MLSLFQSVSWNHILRKPKFSNPFNFH